MKEYDFINYINEKRSKSPAQINKLFESDAEIIELNNSLFAITVDDFSAEEDFFIHKNPEAIGWNLAVATISDLFACGVIPKFFLHTILRSSKEDNSFYKKLTDGIFTALDACNCFLLGGDIGSAASWRYTGIAIGEIKKHAVTRVIKCYGDFDIWISGTLGDANYALLQKEDIPHFELRLEEAELINKCSSSCTDTSGGFCDALWNLKKVNPTFDFKINLDAIPLNKNLIEFTSKNQLPPELALIGGAGEYELLTLVPSKYSSEFDKNSVFTKIGCSSPASNKGDIEFYRNGTMYGKMQEPPPCYRSCEKKDYLKTTIEYYNNNFDGWK